MGSENKRLLRFILLLFFLNKIVILIPSIIARKSQLSEQNMSGWIYSLFFENFNRWDSGWYLSIINEGYNLKSTAFFPLYPILVESVSRLINLSPVVSGIFISNLAFLVLLYFFAKLVRLDYGENETYKIVILLALFPTSFYFSALYTESLFMLFVTISLYLLRQKKWMGAALAGMLAGGTRNTGVLLAIPYAIEFLMYYYQQNGHKFKINLPKMLPILWGIFIPVIAFIYMGYLWKNFNDPFSFSSVQEQYGRGFMAPWDTIIEGYTYNAASISEIISNLQGVRYIDIYNSIELFFMTLIILTLIFSFKKMRFSYWIILLYSVLIPLSAPAYENVKDYFVSISRYALVIVPFYIGIYEVFKKKYLYISLLIIFILLLMLLVYYWSSSLWVA